MLHCDAWLVVLGGVSKPMNFSGVYFGSWKDTAVDEDGKGSGQCSFRSGGSSHACCSSLHFHFFPQVRHLLYLPVP